MKLSPSTLDSLCGNECSSDQGKYRSYRAKGGAYELEDCHNLHCIKDLIVFKEHRGSKLIVGNTKGETLMVLPEESFLLYQQTKGSTYEECIRMRIVVNPNKSKDKKSFIVYDIS